MPRKGINALDGLLLAYQAISNLRQHIRSTERIHGIVQEGVLRRISCQIDRGTILRSSR